MLVARVIASGAPFVPIESRADDQEGLLPASNAIRRATKVADEATAFRICRTASGKAGRCGIFSISQDFSIGPPVVWSVGRPPHSGRRRAGRAPRGSAAWRNGVPPITLAVRLRGGLTDRSRIGRDRAVIIPPSARGIRRLGRAANQQSKKSDRKEFRHGNVSLIYLIIGKCNRPGEQCQTRGLGTRGAD